MCVVRGAVGSGFPTKTAIYYGGMMPTQLRSRIRKTEKKRAASTCKERENIRNWTEWKRAEMKSCICGI